jgi:hypothetical protein
MRLRIFGPEEAGRYWEQNAGGWTRLCRPGYDTYRDLFRALSKDTHGRIDGWLFCAAPPAAKAGLRQFQVPRFHRPLSVWLNAVVDAGFRIERVAGRKPGGSLCNGGLIVIQ